MKQLTAYFGRNLLSVTKRNLWEAEQKVSALKQGNWSLHCRKALWIMSRTSCWNFLRNTLNRITMWSVSLPCTTTNARPTIISISSFRSESCLMSLWRRLPQGTCFMMKPESMYVPKKRYWMKPVSFEAVAKLFPGERCMSVTFLPSRTADLRATVSLMK